MKADSAKPKNPAGKPGLQTRLAATTLLTRVIDDQRNLDALCDREHGLDVYLSLSSLDRGLSRAIVVSALRNRRHIEAVLAKALDRPPPKRARFLIHSLHIAVAQILFLDVPANATVDLAVTAIGQNQTSARFRGLANAVLRRVARERDNFVSDAFAMPSVFPPWLGKALRKDYGKANLDRIAAAVAMRPKVDISVKSNPEKWAERLDGMVLPNGSVRLASNTPVTELEGFETGEWWVQDAAAAIPANLMDSPPGAKVLELCAAPGGKTAQLINMGFDVTALDISKPRIERMRCNLARLGLAAKVVCADVFEWQSDSLFDAVLLDAPCSSTGTIRRHPDVMWTKSANEISKLAGLQYQMALKALEFVRPGGVLVFSNCSILKEEGEDLHARLLKSEASIESSQIRLDEVFGLSALINRQGAVRSLPFHLEMPGKEYFGGMDGFFASRLRKRS